MDIRRAALLALLCLACGKGKNNPGGMANLNIAVNGDGKVVSSPAGINCQPICTAQFAQGATVTLTASGGTQSFMSWGEACSGNGGTCTLTMNGDEEVSAQFGSSTIQYTLGIAINGAGAVTSAPAGINCPGTCTASFDANTNVVLTATWGSDALFGGWMGPCTGVPGGCTVQMISDQAITATFVPAPTLSITPSVSTIVLPENCPASFAITNTGPEGSTLTFTVADDGALGGFLDLQNPSGTLPSGQTAIVNATVKPEFVSGTPSVAGDDLVLDVYTPGATNYSKFPVSVQVQDEQTAAQALLGTWTGTWSGTANGNFNATTSVAGTWSLSLESVDLTRSTCTGSLTWDGEDSYFDYTQDSSSASGWDWTPEPFIPNRTIELQSAAAVTTLTGSGCPLRFPIDIEGFENAANPSDAFYGPRLTLELYPDGTIEDYDVAWSAHPYDPSDFATGESSGVGTGGFSP